MQKMKSRNLIGTLNNDRTTGKALVVHRASKSSATKPKRARKGKPPEQSESQAGLTAQIADSLLDTVGSPPKSGEKKADVPVVRARELTSNAALKAAALSGALAVPPGPWGLLTILPDLVGIWQIQTQLVADIASAYGEKASLTRETMLYCLFRHSAAQAVRDLAVRVGERFITRRVSLRALQRIAEQVGVKVTQRLVKSAVARWLPIVGAVGVAAYAYYDTGQVGNTATKYFKRTSIKKPGPRRIAAPRRRATEKNRARRTTT